MTKAFVLSCLLGSLGLLAGSAAVMASSPVLQSRTFMSGWSLLPIQTITVVPDATYRTGGFCRINYIPATDKFVVTFGTGEYGGPPNPGNPQGQVYKEYTTALEYTGRHGYFFMGGGDSASVVVGNTYYFLTGGPRGLRLIQYDAATWKELKRVDIDIDQDGGEITSDQMLVYVNGLLDTSSFYDPSKTPNPYQGAATWHRFFTLALNFVERRVLDDLPHGNGSSMVFVGGSYYLVTSTAYFGDLVAMRYDQNWNFLGAKTLVRQAQWSQGTVFDAQANHFYVAYIDNSRRPANNTHLAVFDRNWELLVDTAVTNFQPGERKAAGRPWVMQYGNRLYVSYDANTMNANGETNSDWQCLVSVYELSGTNQVYIPLIYR
jgi:hypothetical protein